MKGIILAGGSGTRLFPATKAICKQLLPIFDKPMIYYPLSVLMLAGIREILIISTPHDTPIIQKLFQDGSDLGLQLSYAVQNEPKGLAEAFVIGESFVKQEPVALILGDNLFYGHGFTDILKECSLLKEGGIIFGYHVKNPSRYGVVSFDEHHRAIAIDEKPKNPKSRFAVPGLYFYDQHVCRYVKSLQSSSRGELEITDLNRIYLEKQKLNVKLLGKGYAWLDTGTFDSYQKASSYVQAIQERQGILIGCIEEIAYRKGFILREQLEKMAEQCPNNEYGEHLRGYLLESKEILSVN